MLEKWTIELILFSNLTDEVLACPTLKVRAIAKQKG